MAHFETQEEIRSSKAYLIPRQKQLVLATRQRSPQLILLRDQRPNEAQQHEGRTSWRWQPRQDLRPTSPLPVWRRKHNGGHRSWGQPSTSGASTEMSTLLSCAEAGLWPCRQREACGISPLSKGIGILLGAGVARRSAQPSALPQALRHTWTDSVSQFGLLPPASPSKSAVSQKASSQRMQNLPTSQDFPLHLNQHHLPRERDGTEN